MFLSYFSLYLLARCSEDNPGGRLTNSVLINWLHIHLIGGATFQLVQYEGAMNIGYSTLFSGCWTYFLGHNYIIKHSLSQGLRLVPVENSKVCLQV